MAIKVSQQIEASGFKGIADVSQIAYSYKTLDNIEQIDKSVKDILDLLTEGSNSVLQAIQDASVLEQSISSMRTALVSQFSNNINEMNLKKEEFNLSVTQLNSKLDSVLDTANTLQLAFNSGTDFAVMSESAYNNSQNKQNNVIYFIYEDPSN